MKINDSNFILQMKSGNERALQYAIDCYGGLVKSIIRKHLFEEAQDMFLEECISDVFLGIWNNIDCFNEEKSTVKNWIAGIARFKAIDYGRKYLRIRKHETGFSEEQQEIEATAAISGQDELSQQMEALLQNLKPEDRELFMTIYVEEYSITEISEKTGLKKDFIYNRLSRGRKKLKALYNGNERRI